MKTYFRRVWCALLGRPMMHRVHIDGTANISDSDCSITNCEFISPEGG